MSEFARQLKNNLPESGKTFFIVVLALVIVIAFISNTQAFTLTLPASTYTKVNNEEKTKAIAYIEQMRNNLDTFYNEESLDNSKSDSDTSSSTTTASSASSTSSSQQNSTTTADTNTSTTSTSTNTTSGTSTIQTNTASTTTSSTSSSTTAYNPPTNTPPTNSQQPAIKPTNTSYSGTGSNSGSTGNWWDYPSTILPVTKSGNDLLVLVNKKYKLPSSYTPSLSNLGSITACKNSSSHSLRPEAKSALANLCTAAKNDGVTLKIQSTYRSYSTQQSTYNYWVGQVGKSQADKISARAGHSQHQLGTALDFATYNSSGGELLWQSFNNTTAATWLKNNAWKYGFVIAYPQGYEATTGFSYESWHYRFIGVDNAASWKSSGKILELWLREKNGL